MKNFFVKFYYLWRQVKDKYTKNREHKKLQKLYPDFRTETEYDCGEHKFIWGIASPDELYHGPTSLHTINDIDIIYSRAKKRYILAIETAYWFESQESVILYLQRLLNKFTKYMDEQGYNKNAPYKFWMSQPSALFEAESIPELYTNFKIFVEGYKAVGGNARKQYDNNVQLL